MSSPSFSSEQVKMANHLPMRTLVPFLRRMGELRSRSKTRALCSGLA